MHVSVEATCSSDTGKCWSGFHCESWPEFLKPWPRIAKETHSSGLLAVLANQTEKESIHVEKQDGNTAHNRFRNAHQCRHDLATASAVHWRYCVRCGGGSAPEPCR